MKERAEEARRVDESVRSAATILAGESERVEVNKLRQEATAVGLSSPNNTTLRNSPGTASVSSDQPNIHLCKVSRSSILDLPRWPRHRGGRN